MIRPGKIIRASSIKDIPEPRMTVQENIKKILGNKTLSSFQITRHMSNKSKSNIRSVMANMVREGELECNNCTHCEIGKTYKVKK